ncbi:unnamed protein product [Blepharisma stoltei]|uniref:EGF-like domain-containing protein n=1 Tax=Blepharisma stoltei TaxID=1481888 RepID=A0AAU9JAH5_9CILI|nr:unnamed protein product [Blepharisma stoltei]
MARSTQLKACFIIFCLSFGITAYSPLAKWVFTPNNLVNGKINDLSSYSNTPFQKSEGSIASSDVTCKGLHTYKDTSNAFYYGTVSAITSSTVEFGVSIWMSSQGNGVPFQIVTALDRSSEYSIWFKNPEIYVFQLYGGKTEVPISQGKWVFLVFNFVKSQDIWTWTVISPEFSTFSLTSYGIPGNIIKIAWGSDAYFYEIQLFIKGAINSPIVTLYDSSDANYDATTSTCLASCTNYCHPDVGCLSSAACPCPTLCKCPADDGVCSSCNDPNSVLANKCQCKTNYALEGLTCVLKYPLDCAQWTSDKVCTQCNPNFFLYNSGSSISCLACDSCTSCNASPTCFKCTDLISQAGNSCRVDSIGYKLSFVSPNIIVDFAYPLAKALKISSLQAATTNNQALATTTWEIHSQTVSQLQIRTDLTLSQLPIKLNFSFEQDD